MPRYRSAAAARSVWLGLAASIFVSATWAHGAGEDRIEEGQAVSADPLDTVLWIHIFLQMFAFGILFPLGMVLGMTKSVWHVPVQVLSTILAVIGFLLGHMHGGRQFRRENAHARLATPLFVLLAAQVSMGAYLKLHLSDPLNTRVRRLVRPAHGVLGKAFPVLSWAQMVLGGVTALGFCQGEHLGQCASRLVAGSALVAYGAALTIVLVAGQLLVRRSGRSQELYESAAIAAWGCVSTFAALRWGEDGWETDWERASLGVAWWCAGLVGIWLSRDRDGAPRRNLIPGFVLALTGWALTTRARALRVSEEVHGVLGYTLIAAGLVRVIEIAFVLRDSAGISEDGRQASSFQFIPAFLLYAAGFLYMGATEEQMVLIADSTMDAVSYVLVLFSLAFLAFLFVNMLVYIYDRNAAESAAAVLGGGGGGREDQWVRDAEEFELDGLVSDGEDNGEALLKDERGPSTSTMVNNSDEYTR